MASTPRIRRSSSWTLALAGLAGALGAACTTPQPASRPPSADARPAAERLDDAEFWALFATASEAGGSFPSENFVSNEMTYQHVIPALQRSLAPDGVYLGVGPEQNFTYIANLRPRLAVIVDIRRQNAMQHLMYKALFELSPTRAEFVARLFARPAVARLRTAPALSAQALFDSADVAAPDDSAFRATADAVVATLTGQHRFALSPADRASIDHVYRVFREAGPGIDYAYRLGRGVVFGSPYPTYAMVQTATNAEGAPMAFLASEEAYRAVRDLQLRNLIVPVVGDFGGPTAIRAVGAFLARRGLSVTAFYLSNVEQYLYRSPGAVERFYANVAALPLDSTSTFIRSVPPGPMGSRVMTMAGSGGVVSGTSQMGAVTVSFAIRDSAGTRVMRTVVDSGGVTVARTMRDSAGTWVAQRDSVLGGARTGVLGRDSVVASLMRQFAVTFDTTRAVMPFRPAGAPPAFRAAAAGSLLASGLAPIRGTLEAFAAGRLPTYQDAIGMTKTSGWK
jgi:hypothetical protein